MHSLNDSHFVCMAIYNIVVCVIVGIPLAFLINEHVDALVGCLSFFLLLPTTVTLCLLFIPKVRGILVRIKTMHDSTVFRVGRGWKSQTAGELRASFSVQAALLVVCLGKPFLDKAR